MKNNIHLMYFALLYKDNFKGVFTSFLKAKRYIDKNFEFDFIDSYQIIFPLKAFDYYYNWEIISISKVYKNITCDVCVSIEDVKKIDNRYNIRGRLSRYNPYLYKKIDIQLKEIEYAEILNLQYIIETEIKMDLKVLNEQIIAENSKPIR
jgi:hypothetical protein